MARPDVTPAIFLRKRGNPNWGSGGPVKLAPALATEFEMQVRLLRLTPEAYVFSDELRRWCNRNRKSVLHSRMASQSLGHPRRSILQRRRLTEDWRTPLETDARNSRVDRFSLAVPSEVHDG